MKAEHRKELQTNVLADNVGRLLQNIKSGSNTSLIVFAGVALVIVGLIVTWRVVATTSANERSALWVRLDEATNAEELQKLAQDKPGSIPGRIARFEQARILLRQGEQQLLSPDRSKALKDIQEAQGLYDKLAQESGDTPVLHQEALLGAARARECQGDLAGARRYYDNLAQLYPNSTLGKKAAAWTATQEQRQDFYTRLDQLATAKNKSSGQ